MRRAEGRGAREWRLTFFFIFDSCSNLNSLHILLSPFARCSVPSQLASYSSDMELEDCVHQAILTLKEGYEGAMSDTSLEIGIATMEQVEITDVSVEGGKRTETRGKFRKLMPSEVRDYLANIA